MSNNVLYELLVEDKHIDIIISALNNYIHSQYEGVDSEIVDIPVTLENIKIASDIQLVLKHTVGDTKRKPTQTSQHTGLVWCKEIDLDEYCDQVSSNAEDMFDHFNDDMLQCNITEDVSSPRVSELLHKAWNNVKDKHWDTIKQLGDK